MTEPKVKIDDDGNVTMPLSMLKKLLKDEPEEKKETKDDKSQGELLLG